MNILFFFVHPGAYHVLKSVIRQLKQDGHNVDITIINKDVLPELITQDGLAYTDIFPEGRQAHGMLNAAWLMLKTVWRLHRFIGTKHYDLFVTDDCLAINGWLKKIPTLFLIDDDIDVVPEITLLLHCATQIVAPQVTRLGRYENKKIGFRGYKELAYLHPDVFHPEPTIPQRYGLTPRHYLFIRLVGLTATHDRNKHGIDNDFLLKIVECAEKHQLQTIISSERILPENLEKYRLRFPSEEGLDLLGNAALFIGDSQTMTSEAALLGIPALRCNDFVGRISVMEEKETRYGLTFGYLPKECNKLIEKMTEILDDPEYLKKWQQKYQKMLAETIDISALLYRQIYHMGCHYPAPDEPHSVLHISCHRNVDRRIIGELNHCVRQGWKTAFLFTPLALDGAGLSEKVELWGDNISGLSTTNRKKSHFTMLGYRVITHFPLIGAWLFYFASKFFSLLYARRLEQKRRNGGSLPEIIHVHDVWLLDYAKQLKRRYYPHARLVYDAHEFTPFQTPNKAETVGTKLFEKQGIRHLDAMIAVNSSIAEGIAQLYHCAKPMVLYNSAEISDSQFAVTREEFLQHFGIQEQWLDNAPVILYQGTLAPERNLENLVTAFTQTEEHLFLLADGPLKEKLQEIVHKSGHNNIHFACPVASDKLLAYTACADFGILPYIAFGCENNRLCSPNKLFEYIAAEIPILASDLPELSKIIGRFNNGRCYPLDSVEKIVFAVKEMTSLWKKGMFLHENAVKANEFYSYESQMKKLSQLYDNLLDKKMISELKILHLPCNLASQMSVSVLAERKAGANSVGYYKKTSNMQSGEGLTPFLCQEVSQGGLFRSLYKLYFTAARIWTVLRQIWKADVLHYYAYPALPWGIDILWARLLHKPGVVEFWGSDIRIPEIASKNNPYMKKLYQEHPILSNVESRRNSFVNQRRFAKAGFCGITCADTCPCLQTDWFEKYLFSAVRISLDLYIPHYPDVQKEIPLVVHMPSDSLIKGTEFVLKAVEELQKKYRFEFRLIQNMSHSEALKVLESSDILCEQFVIGGHGVNAVEGMAIGKPVLSYIHPDLRQYFPEDLPIVSASPENIAEELEKLLKDPELRNQLGRWGRLYVEQHHDASKIAFSQLQLYTEMWERKQYRP